MTNYTMESENTTYNEGDSWCNQGLLIPFWFPNDRDDFLILDRLDLGSIYLLALIYILLGLFMISNKMAQSLKKIKRIQIDKYEYSEISFLDTKNYFFLTALATCTPVLFLSFGDTQSNDYSSHLFVPTYVLDTAAFNTFLIVGIIFGFSGEIQRFKNIGLFITTSLLSIGAFIWMYFVFKIQSPGVIDLSEAILTLLLLPTTYMIFKCSFKNVNIVVNTPANQEVIELNLEQGNESQAEIISLTWGQQFKNLFKVSGDGESNNFNDYFVHCLTFIWKIVLAIIPPIDFLGGYPAFISSFLTTGLLTLIIRDLFHHMTCFVGLKSSDAIILSVGISLRDAVASKSCRNAEMSIINALLRSTINVSIGLGILWILLAIDNEFFKPADSVYCPYLVKHFGTCFKLFVEAESLSYLLVAYCHMGLAALVVIFIKYYSTLYRVIKLPGFAMLGFFFILWTVFVLMTILDSYGFVN